jgi:hypothetical protein
MQDEVESVLTAMFQEKDAWPVQELMAELRSAGCSTTKNVLAKVKAKMGIRSGNEFSEDGRIQGWVWTTETRKLRGMR